MEKLQNAINTISNEYGSPLFVPHITLVSGFIGDEYDLINTTKKISYKLSPGKIYFQNIMFLNEYFCSIFLKVKYNSYIKISRKIACEVFGFRDNNFFPHLSLAYGNFTDSEKQKIKSNLNCKIESCFVNKIFLAHNDEINLKWKIIKGFKLGD